jgi:hypothetical protein
MAKRPAKKRSASPAKLSPKQARRYAAILRRQNRNVAMLRQRYEAGDNRALLDTLLYCFTCGVRPPLWAALEYGKHYTTWRKFKVRSLDEAFGVVREGIHIEQAALSERRKMTVVVVVEYLKREAKQQGEPRLSDNKALIRAAALLGTSEGEARKLYRARDNLWRKVVPAFDSITVPWIPKTGLRKRQK